MNLSVNFHHHREENMYIKIATQIKIFSNKFLEMQSQ